MQNPCGRHAGPRVQEPRGPRRAVPDVAAHAAAGHAVERRRVGDAGRPRQDGLDAGALLRLLPQPPGDAVRAVARRRVVRRRAAGVGVVRAAAGHGGAQGGAGEAHDLRLLRG